MKYFVYIESLEGNFTWTFNFTAKTRKDAESNFKQPVFELIEEIKVN